MLTGRQGNTLPGATADAAGPFHLAVSASYLRDPAALLDELPDGWAFAGALIILTTCPYIVRGEAVLRKQARESGKPV
jgi:hypothetical protein